MAKYVIDLLEFDGIKSKRIGIFGGTFDPIHLGHLFCAEQALDAANLDMVAFVPANIPVFKQERKITSVDDRMRMCELAVADNSKFCVSDIETRRGGITYTADTIRELKSSLYDNVELFFIIGEDSLLTLEYWKDARWLADNVNIICVSRLFDQSTTKYGQRLFEQGFSIQFVETPSLEISSTDIRTRVRLGRSIRYLVPESVREFIESRRLYLDPSD